MIGNEYVKVYTDKFIYTYASFYKKLSIEESFFYKDVKSVKFQGFFTSQLSSLLIPTTIKPQNRLIITYKSNEQKIINTSLNFEQLKKAIELINSKC
jgi:hypothetical protein